MEARSFSGAAKDPASTIRILDLTTHQISTCRARRGCTRRDGLRTADIFPLFPPTRNDFSYLISRPRNGLKLAKGTLGWLEWSKDGQYLQADDGSGTGAIIRIRLSDRKTERIVDLKNFVPDGLLHGCTRSRPTIRP